MICPDCRREVSDTEATCKYCKFDLRTYKMIYQQKYREKLYLLEQRLKTTNGMPGAVPGGTQQVTPGVPRCPYCGSTNLVKISAVSKIADDAIRGLYATTRYHQWRCKSCNSEF